jgi:uncharacterized protein (TIGR02391 family)
MSRAVRRLVRQYNELVAVNQQFAAHHDYNCKVIYQQNTTIQQQNEIIQDLRKQVADPFRLALPLLHPKIQHRCRASFESGQYEDTIFNAAKTIEDEIRRLIGAAEESLGTSLIADALAPGKNPPLILSTVTAEQEGVHSLFRGVIAWLKNPRSHRYLDTDNRTAAFEVLAFASYLMRMLDTAKASGQGIAPGANQP